MKPFITLNIFIKSHINGMYLINIYYISYKHRKKGIGHDVFLIKSKREKMSMILNAELRKDKKFFLFFTYTNNRFLNLQNFKVSCKLRYLCSFSTLIFSFVFIYR